MAPAVKKTRATRMRALRPKMSERAAKVGWKTVEVRRKEVPDQKASMAVPPSLEDIICGWFVSGGGAGGLFYFYFYLGGGRRTGRATEREVASRAAVRVMTHMVRRRM